LAVVAQPHRDVADEVTVEGDRDLQPVAGRRPVEVGLLVDQPLRRRQRVGRRPALVTGDRGLGAVRRQARRVGGSELPEHEPFGRDRQKARRDHPNECRGRGWGLRPSSLAPMKVRVDAEKCQGHNRCYALAPELFDVDDFGQAVVIGDGEVAAELEEKARLAVANCPEYAISIEENGG
jgi:ferredoxin